MTKNKYYLLIILIILWLISICWKTDYTINFSYEKKQVPFLDTIPPSYAKYNCVKNVPEAYQALFGFVCRYFPELKNEDITFKTGDINTTMQTRPALSFKRKYVIILNKNSSRTGVRFDEIPVPAKIGLLAHELSHILDYKDKNFFQLLCLVPKILSKKGNRAYERGIDKLTIAKGFGLYLKEWAKYTMFNEHISSEYKTLKINNYLSPREIDSIIRLSGGQ